MTWGEFKEQMDAAGVEDWMQIGYIDVAGWSNINVHLPATTVGELQVTG